MNKQAVIIFDEVNFRLSHINFNAGNQTGMKAFTIRIPKSIQVHISHKLKQNQNPHNKKTTNNDCKQKNRIEKPNDAFWTNKTEIDVSPSGTANQISSQIFQ